MGELWPVPQRVLLGGATVELYPLWTQRMDQVSGPLNLKASSSDCSSHLGGAGGEEVAEGINSFRP